MNHRFEKNDRDLIIILNNEIKLIYAIYYDLELKYYYVYMPKGTDFVSNSFTSYKHKYCPEIIQYLVSNNICTIDEAYNYSTYNILILTPHSVLGLI